MTDRRKALERAIQTQLDGVESMGINDDFQAGYVCALIHSWGSVGYTVPEKAWEMLYLHMVGAPQTTPSTHD